MKQFKQVRAAFLPWLIATVMAASASAQSPTSTDAPAGNDAPATSALIYTYDEMFGFDIEKFLGARAPHLLPYAEVISHWSGYTSISPQVLIALIELQSGAVSSPNLDKESEARPFGKLSDKSGFAEQVQDVADRLANDLYSNKASLSGRSEFGGNVTADPLEALLARTGRSAAVGDATEAYSDFVAVYNRLYAEPWAARTKSSVVVKAIPPSALLQMPYPRGARWHVGGTHTSSGSGNYPMGSLDMSVGGGWGSNQSGNWVVAAAGGQVKRHSSCHIEVVHSSGWSTTYYHMMNLQQATGATVTANQRLGNPANTKGQALCNGGSSTGPHQHFSLKYNGSYSHLDGVSLSGYAIKAGRYSYDTNCSYYWLTRNSVKYCAGYLTN